MQTTGFDSVCTLVFTLGQANVDFTNCTDEYQKLSWRFPLPAATANELLIISQITVRIWSHFKLITNVLFPWKHYVLLRLKIDHLSLCFLIQTVRELYWIFGSASLLYSFTGLCIGHRTFELSLILLQFHTASLQLEYTIPETENTARLFYSPVICPPW